MDLEESRVLAANAAFYAAFAAGDVAAMDDLWARRAVVACIHPGGDVLLGRAAVMASWRAILASGDNRIVAAEPRAQVLGEAAFVVCLEGARGAAPSLAATNVFAREAGEWKLVHHQAGPLVRPRAVSSPVAN
jgi:ketosteroid isomerase-like protein